MTRKISTLLTGALCSLLLAVAALPAAAQSEATVARQMAFEKQWELVEADAPLVAIAYLEAANALVAALLRQEEETCEVIEVGVFRYCLERQALAPQPIGRVCETPTAERCERCDPRPEEYDIGCELNAQLCEMRNNQALLQHRLCLAGN